MCSIYKHTYSKTIPFYVSSTYINTKMYVCSFCLSVHVILGDFETDWETLWHIVAFCSWECSQTIIFLLILFSKELFPFLYISLRLTVNLKNDYRNTKGGRNLIIFAKKSTGHREKFTGKKCPKVARFFLYACLS